MQIVDRESVWEGDMCLEAENSQDVGFCLEQFVALIVVVAFREIVGI